MNRETATEFELKVKTNAKNRRPADIDTGKLI